MLTADELRSEFADMELVQTHISLVFLTRDRAYKVKRSVRFAFVDLTDPERRRELCHEEVRLNRALAPHLYLGVVPITRGADGRLRFGGEGEALEWAVEMRRFDQQRLVSRLLQTEEGRGEVGRALPALVEKLANFHADAPRADELGSVDAVAQRILPVLKVAEEHLAPVLARPIRAYLETRLREWPDLFAMRASQGFVREVHGDLHAANVCLDDELQIYDRLEFSRDMRCGDVAFDIAFLAMSFDMEGARDLGRQLCALYAEWTEDLDFERLCSFYKVQRALVRGNVTRMRGDNEPRARRYDRLAAGYVAGPCAVLLCGLPATGKTTIARALAAPLSADVLRSDVVRKRMAGMQETERWSGGMYDGPYDPAMTDRVYGQLALDVRARLDAGESVIVDATLRSAAHRECLLDAVQRVPWCVVYLVRTDAEVHRNLAARRDAGNYVSDADEEYYAHAKQTFEPPTEIRAEHLVRDDGQGDVEDLLDSIVGRLAEMRTA